MFTQLAQQWQLSANAIVGCFKISLMSFENAKQSGKMKKNEQMLSELRNYVCLPQHCL